MTSQHHGNPFGDTGLDEVSDRRATEVVGNPPRAPSHIARRMPRLIEVLDLTPVPMEDPWDDLVSRLLNLFCEVALSNE